MFTFSRYFGLVIEKKVENQNLNTVLKSGHVKKGKYIINNRVYLAEK